MVEMATMMLNVRGMRGGLYYIVVNLKAYGLNPRKVHKDLQAVLSSARRWNFSADGPLDPIVDFTYISGEGISRLFHR